MRLRMNPDREDALRRVMQLSGEKTKSGAIDRALKHYAADLQNKRAVADDLDTDTLERLSTGQMPLRRETTVGPDTE